MCPWHSIVLRKLCVRVPGQLPHMIVTAVLAVVGVAFVNVTCFLCNENAMAYRCFGKHGPKVLFSSNRCTFCCSSNAAVLPAWPCKLLSC